MISLTFCQLWIKSQNDGLECHNTDFLWGNFDFLCYKYDLVCHLWFTKALFFSYVIMFRLELIGLDLNVFLRSKFTRRTHLNVCVCVCCRWWAERVWRRCIRTRPNARPITRTPGASSGSRGQTCWASVKSWVRLTCTITAATLGSSSTPRECSVCVFRDNTAELMNTHSSRMCVW